jgi:hypothetical protein
MLVITGGRYRLAGARVAVVPPALAGGRRSTYPEVFGGFFPAVSHDFVAHFRAFIQIA